MGCSGKNRFISHCKSLTFLQKRFFVPLVAGLVWLSAFAGQTIRPAEWLGIKDHDFGLLSRGRPAQHRFVLKNKGTQPLLIDNVRTPCGCTAVDWPEMPISPGDTASVLVEYNAAQSGYFYKTVKVFFHGIKGADVLSVQGEVE